LIFASISMRCAASQASCSWRIETACSTYSSTVWYAPRWTSCRIAASSSGRSRSLCLYSTNSVQRQHHPIHASGIRVGARVAGAHGEAAQIVAAEDAAGSFRQRLRMQAGIGEHGIALRELVNWGRCRACRLAPWSRRRHRQWAGRGGLG